MALERLGPTLKVLLITVLVVEGIAVAQKPPDGQNIGVRHVAGTQCGIWVRTSNGGHFASPSYPDPYPPNRECTYVLEAAPRQRIELAFDQHFHIEPSFECRFDHLEVRDGPFGFSPLIDRFCGARSPPLLRSTGRFLWVRFSSDEELEGLGFRAKYSFIPDPDFTYLGGILNPIPGLVCSLFFLPALHLPACPLTLPLPCRLPVRALGGRRRCAVQPGGAGGEDEARPGGGLHLDHPGHPEGQDLPAVPGLPDGALQRVPAELRGRVRREQRHREPQGQVLQHGGQRRDAAHGRGRGAHVGGRGQPAQPLPAALHLLRGAALHGQHLLLPQQHVHQQLAGLQRRPELRLPVGREPLQREEAGRPLRADHADPRHHHRRGLGRGAGAAGGVGAGAGEAAAEEGAGLQGGLPQARLPGRLRPAALRALLAAGQGAGGRPGGAGRGAGRLPAAAARLVRLALRARAPLRGAGPARPPAAARRRAALPPRLRAAPAHEDLQQHLPPQQLHLPAGRRPRLAPRRPRGRGGPLRDLRARPRRPGPGGPLHRLLTRRRRTPSRAPSARDPSARDPLAGDPSARDPHRPGTPPPGTPPPGTPIGQGPLRPGPLRPGPPSARDPSARDPHRPGTPPPGTPSARDPLAGDPSAGDPPPQGRGNAPPAPPCLRPPPPLPATKTCTCSHLS